MKITSLLAVALLAVTASAGTVSTYCGSSSNSTGQVAQIGYTGSLLREANTFGSTLTQAAPNGFGQLICGSHPYGFNVPFGNGSLCINPLNSFVRVGGPMPVNASGEALCAVNMLEMPGTSTLYFQWMYRDVPAGGSMFNTSNAMVCTFD